MFQTIIQQIEQFDTITIFGHIYPDGDCYGSQIGLRELIKTTYPHKKVFAIGSGFPDFFTLISPMDVVTDDTIASSLAIILDVADVARIEDQRFLLANKTVKIDHHIFAEKFADFEYIDNTKVATCEIIASLLFEKNLKINKMGATALFLGILTDSGRFQYAPTSAHTFDMVAKLVAHDVDFKAIFDRLNITPEAIARFKGYLLLNFRKTTNGVIYVTLTKDQLAEYGLTAVKATSFVNLVGSIDQAPIWVFFAEDELGTVRCEIRSFAKAIQPIASNFGGGGHKLAAGCRLTSLDQTKEVLALLDALVQEGN